MLLLTAIVAREITTPWQTKFHPRLATYGSFFLTAEPNSFVYTKGSTATVTVTAQDYDKKPVPTPLRIEMNRWDWRKGAGAKISSSQSQTDASGNLMTANGDAVMDMLTSIMNGGTTVIMVTHSEEHAKRAHRVVHMLDGRFVDYTEG